MFQSKMPSEEVSASFDGILSVSLKTSKKPLEEYSFTLLLFSLTYFCSSLVMN